MISLSSVSTYYVSRDGNKQLTKNFKVREFQCNDGSDKVLICMETVKILQAVRDYFGQPVTINSAYRTPSWNRKVRGAVASQHVKGTACDIKVKGVPSWAVAGFLEDNYPYHGIGYYSTFVHIDSRGYKVYWKDSGSNTKGSFHIGKNYTEYKARETVKPVITPKPVTPTKPKEEDKMTDKEIYDALNRYTKTLPLPEWAREEWQEAIDMGITDGSNPMQLIPRYQAAIMAKRAVKVDKK